MDRRPRRHLKLVVDRKAALMLIALVVLVGGAGLLSSQQLTMTATYPIPAGVYNQIVTTGNSGTAAADTTLNRNAGNTILVPPTNASGNVGVGTASPASYAKLDVNTSGNNAIHVMDSANGGLLVGFQGPTIQARDTGDGNSANLILQGWGGSVGVGTASPASALSVAGGIQPGDDTAACTVDKAGTQRWHAGHMETCRVIDSWGTTGWEANFVWLNNSYGSGEVASDVMCPGQRRATGGGGACYQVLPFAHVAELVESYPRGASWGAATGWHVVCGHPTTSGVYIVTVWVICQ